MTAPAPQPSQPEHADPNASKLLRAAIWVAIGALIAAAIVCVIWVLIGSQNGIVARAFLTILLLVGFAGVSILDAHLAPRRPVWFALASMASWIVALLIGAVMIWMPERNSWSGVGRFVSFLLIVLILQLAVLHVRLYMKAFRRYVTVFTQVVTIVTIALVVGLAALLIVPLMLSDWIRFADIYWRITVAVAILAAVGTALIPLVNVLFAPKKPRPVTAQPAPYGGQPAPYGAQAVPYGTQPAPYGSAAPAAPAASPAQPAQQQELLPWPTFVDGVTPLPMMPDGSPDWGAYYTGYPSEGAQVFTRPEPAQAPEQTAPAVEPSAAEPPAPSHGAPGSGPGTPAGYEGYPPPPPLPPRP
ncbi:hypothetical protein [Microbacterium thalassium]|uniref:MFS family permease n=1 Tax=Microbacterium thalassium TaxID=362649 RepID=A0A7X0FTI2_9MICO|nr:hypothetical protein [Microbacterium thalassium]MBB6392905.1 MFS family permease [Microbacterium thalassium]GLK22864.1 hypothetical protein GCM10017607_01820 [Microbacterium thalassium]